MRRRWSWVGRRWSCVRRKSIAAPPSSGALAVLSLVLLALLTTACRKEPPAIPPTPQHFGVGELETEPGATAPSSDAAALPTWTVPAGPGALPPPGQPVEPGGRVPGDQIPGNQVPGGPGGIAPGNSGPPGDRSAGDIPVPTPRARVAVPAAGPPATDPALVRLAGLVSASRLTEDVHKLVGFGTRNALSPADDPVRGVGAARNWLIGEFDRLNGLGGRQVLSEFEDFNLDFGGRATTQRNVIVTLPGIGLTKQIIYLTAHYDSRVADPTNGTADAPGADDNASGTAALLELARVLGQRQWDATLRLIAFAAEEPGLKGSRFHAAAAKRIGLPILAVFNNDIIGSGTGAGGAVDLKHVRVYSADPDDGPSRRLARYAKVIGDRYGSPEVNLIPQADRKGRGGDHQPFSDAGYAAIRLIEAAEDLTRQHNGQDLTDRLNADYHAAVVRLNVVLAGNLALAPPAPESAPALAVPDGPAGAGVLRISWAPVEQANLAGYWVAYRRADAVAYDKVVWAGQGTSFELAGLAPSETARVAVAAADDLGHMSLFSPEAIR